MKKEFYRVSEVSKMYNITSRYTRTKIKELKTIEKYNNLLVKDAVGHWMIHQLTLSNFKRKRKQKQPYYALTFTFNQNLTYNDIENTMKWICNQTRIDDLEFYYSIEKGLKREKNHVHAFTNCKKKRQLINNAKDGFGKVRYEERQIFDLEGWKNYITKDGSKIIEIKKK
jgi:hypothetical protein